MNKDRRLGRGLAALLGEPLEQQPPTDVQHVHSTLNRGTTDPAASGSPPPSDRVEMILLNVYEIDANPFQPRRDFSESEISALAESLKEHDMIQPVVVRKIGDRYQLISGERRLRAATQAGWAQVPARVREADDRLVAELAIVENLQRKDLNPIEKALSFQRYIHEHGCTQENLAARIKVDRSTVANLMRLLELPQHVQDAISKRSITAGHARALLPLGDEQQQIEFCNRIRREVLSVRDTEQLVQETIRLEDDEPLNVIDDPKSKQRRNRSSQITALEQELRMSLGTKVDIRQANRSRGRIIVHFSGHDEFDRLHALLTDTGATHRDAG